MPAYWSSSLLPSLDSISVISHSSLPSLNSIIVSRHLLLPSLNSIYSIIASVVPTSMAPAGLRLQSHGFHNTLSSWAKSSVLHPHSCSRAVHYHCRCSFERNHASSPAAYTETQHLSLALWSSIQSHNVWRDQLSRPVSTIQHLACISQPFSACTIIYQLSSSLELSHDPLVLQFAFSFSLVVSHGLSF